MRTAIVTATDLKYLPAACCALLSCVGHGEVGARAKFFILACGVSAGEAKNAHDFLIRRGVIAEIITIEADHLRSFRMDSYISAATYSRLLLPHFFDDRWDRLLYLDADVRVMVPLEPLLDTSLRGRPLGAVHDYLRCKIYGIEESRSRLNLRSDAPYFNAGVICFDWSTTIASGLLRRAQAFATESANLCKSYDQDALNKAFEGAWTPLDPRWNFMTVAVPDDVFPLYYPARLQPYIAHFAGPTKPWATSFPERFEHHRTWYLELLRVSPWPHFVAPHSASPTPIRFSADVLKGWLLTQCRRFRTAFERRWHAASQPRSVEPRRSFLTKVSWNGEANPELEDLLDQMIAEAGGADHAYPAAFRRGPSELT